jgi:Zn-finger nucleic acid-binding protein
VNIWVWLKPKGLDNLLDRVRTTESKKFGEFVQESVAKRTEQEQKLRENRFEGKNIG